MKRRALLATSAAALAARALPSRAAPLRRFGGTLTAGLLGKTPPALSSGDPRTLDPHAARTRLERELAAALHVPLFARAPAHLAGHSAGLLVEQAAPSRDGTSWSVTMRAGLTFADGSALTASEAAASLLRSLAAPGGRVLATVIAEARAKDERHLEIVTRAPVRDLAPILSELSAAVVSTRAVDPFYGPLGAGGFRAPQAGDGAKPSSIRLEASLRSPAGRAWLDRLEVVAGDGADAAAAWRRGTMQVASGVAKTTERERVTGDAASTIALLLSPRLSADLRARAASALDVRTLTQVFLQGARPAASLLPPSLFPAGTSLLTRPHVKGA
ncbi:MAG TPA: ABC transporter substrate-binding protein, partial [bacterium]|nr:ABC transporter substrate-binding protein [bacterium]